jgi:hypothetical protein
VNRRAFAESLALAALAPALGVPADSLRLGGSSQASTGSGDGYPPVAGGDVEDAATLAGTLMTIIRLEYGERLSAADLAGVADQIRAGLVRADLIRQADRGHEA